MNKVDRNSLWIPRSPVKYSTLWLRNFVFFVGTFFFIHFAMANSSLAGFSTSTSAPPGPVYSLKSNSVKNRIQVEKRNIIHLRRRLNWSFCIRNRCAIRVHVCFFHSILLSDSIAWDIHFIIWFSFVLLRTSTNLVYIGLYLRARTHTHERARLFTTSIHIQWAQCATWMAHNMPLA